MDADPGCFTSLGFGGSTAVCVGANEGVWAVDRWVNAAWRLILLCRRDIATCVDVYSSDGGQGLAGGLGVLLFV